MRDDPQSLKGVKVGSIMQIGPDEDHGHRLKLLVVTQVESWGVKGALPDGSIVGRPWDKIEHTGGSIVFDHNGKRIRETAKPKHHE